jgi:hypothetical protein
MEIYDSPGRGAYNRWGMIRSGSDCLCWRAARHFGGSRSADPAAQIG